MAFLDLEAGRLTPPSPSRAVEWGVFQVNTKVAMLRQLADALGTPRDTPTLRDRLRRTRAEITRQAKNTSQTLKRVSAIAAERVAPGSKLAMDLEAALREFQQVQQRIVAADQQEVAAASYRFPFGSPPSLFPPRSYASASLSDLNNGTSGGFSDQQCTAQAQQLLVSRSQERVSLDREIAFNEAIIEEREQGIREVQKEITEIHDIFRDLAMLVHDQGEGIDDVKCNLDKTAAATSQAEEQLSRAAETQESSSSMKCLLPFVVGLILFIVVIVLVG